MAVDVLPPPGEFKTTDEIRDAKFAKELQARRKRMLLWSAPLMLIALLAAVKLLSAVAINMAGTSAYDNANHNTAADRFANLQVFNFVEPWKAYFNEGTAIYASGDFFSATQSLQTALDLVPKSPQGEPPSEDECSVRTNYSLSLEGLGDESFIAGDFAMATSRYEEAQTMLSNCGEAGGNGGEEAQQAEERQQESQAESQDQQEQQEQEQSGDGEPSDQPTDGEGSQSASPSDGEGSQSASPSEGEGSQSASPSEGEGSQSASPSEGEGSQSASPTEGEGSGEPTSRDPQQEELESRNAGASQSADASEQAGGGGNGSGQNW